MPRKPQQDVEQGPFQDVHGRWHNPDGSFASPDDAEQYENDAAQGDPQAQRYVQSTRRSPVASGRQTRQRSYAQQRPEPQPTTPQGHISDLINEWLETHERLGEIAKEIERELGAVLEPVMTLAQRLVHVEPRATTTNITNTERRRGVPLNPSTDRRLKPETRERLLRQQQTDDTAADDDEDNE